jgi:hypothetical protein
VESCRVTLNHLNAYLNKHEGKRAPQYDDAAAKELARLFELDAGEQAEMSSASYTQLDSAHVEMCQLLQDVARTFDVVVPATEGEAPRRLTPLRRAELAFDWTMRQVRLQNYDLVADVARRQIVHEPLSGPPLPPQYVLRRGYGTAVERALVFLALLRQLGQEPDEFTGAILQCRDPKDEREAFLWTCAVVIKGQPGVYLFDPRLGMALLGPNDEGVATLAEARSNPDVLGQLTTDDRYRYDVTLAQAAKAELRLVASISGMATRMKALESDDLLGPVAKTRFYEDVLDEKKRLEKAVNEQLGTTQSARCFYPSTAGTARKFLPKAEGGIDDAKAASRKVRYIRNLVPWFDMPLMFQDENLFPWEVGLGKRVRDHFAQPFWFYALAPHKARDDIMRGQFHRALPDLVKEKEYCIGRMTLMGDDTTELQQRVAKWSEEVAKPLFADQVRAQRERDTVALDAVNRQIEVLWKEAHEVAILLEGSRSKPRLRETIYAIALCKHEQAVRAQIQFELSLDNPDLRQQADAAWNEAANWWAQFPDGDLRAPVEERVAALRQQAIARARNCEWTKAVDLFSKVDVGGMTNLDRVASLYLARRIDPDGKK